MSPLIARPHPMNLLMDPLLYIPLYVAIDQLFIPTIKSLLWNPFPSLESLASQILISLSLSLSLS